MTGLRNRIGKFIHRERISSRQLQNAALVHLLEQLHILSVIHMNAHEHRTGSVESLAQSGSDLVWAIDSQPRGTECLRVLDRVDGPKINAGDAIVLDALLRG